MVTRLCALLLALAFPASAQWRAVMPSVRLSPPARFSLPAMAPSLRVPVLAPSLAAPSRGPSIRVPDLLPPAFAEGRALFDGAAPANGPVFTAAAAAPRGASVRLHEVSLPTRLFSDQDQISASLIKAIDATQGTLEIAIHGLALREVAAALKRAKDRGVRVRIVMNQTHVFPEKERDHREAEVQMLLDEGFEMKMLRGGDLYGVMHNKFAVFDGSVLETGSYNWTAAADRQHFENALFTDEAARVADYSTYWNWLWKQSAAIDVNNPPAKPVFTPRGEERLKSADLPPAPQPTAKSVTFNGVTLPGEAFSPWNAEENVVKAVDAANVYIDVANFSFTSVPLRDALLRAKARGVIVRLVLDEHQFKFLAEMRKLVTLGFEVRLSAGKDGQRGVQHNKMAIIDGKLVQTGSFNWTTNAHKNNFENVLFLDAPDDVAAYAAYYDRIWDQAREPGQGDLESPHAVPEGFVPGLGSPW